MKLQYAQSFFRFGALAVLAGALTLSACNKSSVVNDAPANTTPAGQAPAQSQPAAAASVAPAAATEQAQPNAANAAAVSASPKVTPTPLPIMKEAMAKPGVPVSVPESMRRPLTPEEMQKALQAMPPEVRARIQGLGAAPATPPQPAKKP